MSTPTPNASTSVGKDPILLAHLITTPDPSCEIPTSPSPKAVNESHETKVAELIEYFGSDGYRVGGGEASGVIHRTQSRHGKEHGHGHGHGYSHGHEKVHSKGHCQAQDHSHSHDSFSTHGSSGRLTEDEQIFLSRETITRFLIATKWDLPAARVRLDKCVAWRRKFRVDELEETAKEVEEESYSGKEFVIGYTKKCQPILHFRPNRSTTDPSERQLKHVVYMLERTADMMPGGVSNLMLVIDFTGKRGAPTSIGMARNFIDILQNYYPERLGKASLSSIPWIVKRFLDIAYTFLDPVTKQKVSWSGEIVSTNIAPSSTTLIEYGGSLTFEYIHETYWPTLLRVCLERREANRKAWRKLGGGVGQEEFTFKTMALSESQRGGSETEEEKTREVTDSSTSTGTITTTAPAPIVIPTPTQTNPPPPHTSSHERQPSSSGSLGSEHDHFVTAPSSPINLTNNLDLDSQQGFFKPTPLNLSSLDRELSHVSTNSKSDSPTTTTTSVSSAISDQTAVFGHENTKNGNGNENAHGHGNGMVVNVVDGNDDGNAANGPGKAELFIQPLGKVLEV